MTDSAPPSDSDPIAFVFFNEIGIIEQLSRSRFERVLPDGMSLAQFSVLNNFVRLGGERTPSGLASAFQVTRGAMTNTLQRLEAQGLVSIRPDEVDGRGKIVSITEAGAAMRERCLSILVPVLADFTAAFPDADLSAILPTLRRIRMFLDANRG